jgi:phosphatidylglycerophosphate synthase
LRSAALQRSRKHRVGRELACEHVFRPAAHVLVLALVPARVAPPAVAAASGTTGVVAAVQLGQGRWLLAALLLQLKTVLDNADGQLARLTGRVTALGRYLDSELDLVVNAALFAGIASVTERPLLALAGFLAVTAVLNANYNAERLHRAEHGDEATAMPAAGGRVDGLLRRVYVLLYAPQDRLAERFVAHRLRDASVEARRAYHDRATVHVLANLGMSTQLLVLGVLVAAGRPALFAWFALAELALVLALCARRELLIRTLAPLKEESL